MADPKIVVTLLAERGKKYDETRQCIASFDDKIVFLPRDVKPGQLVRVELKPVAEKKDARGRTMYYAEHAWFDLGRDERNAIACEAEILRSCSEFSEAEALALLTSKFGRCIDAWKGYTHYYFHKTGAVYASKYAPATLLLFEAAKNASWKALVEPLVWIAAGLKPATGDFFALRQEGKMIDPRDTPVPQLTDEEVGKVVRKIEEGELMLSVPLIELGSDGKLLSKSWDWDMWQNHRHPPYFPPPNFNDPNVEIPEEIIEFVFGHDIGGRELKTYGTIGSYSSSGIKFTRVWMETREEALRRRDKAREDLKILRAERALARERELADERRRAEEEAKRRAEEERAREKAEFDARTSSEVAAGRALADFSDSEQVRETPTLWATSAQPKRADRAGKVDPDGPFAKLAELKKKMEEGGK